MSLQSTHRPSRSSLVPTTAVVAVLLAGCGGAEQGEGTTAAPDSADAGSTTSSAGPPDGAPQTSAADQVLTLADGVELPPGPTGEALGWVFDTLNAEEGPTAQQAQQRFAPGFLEQVPAEQASATFEQIRGFGPMRVDSILESGPSLSAEVDAPEPLVVSIAVDEQDRISGLVFAPDPTAGREPATTYDQAIAELGGLGSQVHVLAAQVQDGACVPVHEHDPEQAAPMGSVFKLYVLGALVDAVERGEVAWDDELEIIAEVQSLPSGELQDRPPGTTVTVREAAELMISISDNTATDLLIGRLGADTIEAALPELGVQDSGGLTPLPTTAQFFRLGWDSDETTRRAWAQADTAGQQAILEELAPGVEGIDPLSVTAPRWEQSIGWFASAAEICAAHVALQERAGTEAGAPLRDILAANPGLPGLTEGLDYLGFKGGSAPGAVTFSWYAEAPAGPPLVTVVQVAGGADLSPVQALGPAADVLRLLAEDPGR